MIAAAVCTDIENNFWRANEGFYAIDSGLNEHLCKSIRSIHGVSSWADTLKLLGIYDISRRVKDPKRLLAKVEKLLPEYPSLTASNFYEFVPDIVACRVVCLHPDDMLTLALAIKKCCDESCLTPPGEPHRMLRVRRGHFSVLNDTQFKEHGFDVDRETEVGYTSIHFVFQLGPCFRDAIPLAKRDAFERLRPTVIPERFLVEIQLRTILEEAWAEMDHLVRYEDEQLISDPDLKSHFKAMAAYIQAGNHHISIIREAARIRSSKHS